MDQAPPASELSGPSALAQNTLVTTAAGSGGNVPSGLLSMFVNGTPPSGWLVCDGSAVSRATFSSLFAVIGTAYGAGDGSTTFNLPDLQGRVPVGKGTNASVSSLNANDGQSVANRRPQHRTSNALTGGGQTGGQSADHSHNAEAWAGSGSAALHLTFAASTASQVFFATGGASNDHTHTAPTPGGSIGTNVGTDALDAPSFVVVLFIIKT